MRRATWLGGILATLLAAFWLGLDPRDLAEADPDLWVAFLRAAIQPALYDEATGTHWLVPQVLHATWATVSLATSGMGLALAIAAPLTLSSSVRFTGGGVLCAVSRTVIAAMRSVHELLWAVLFLAALGLTPSSAIIAIAIPYAGTLAKVFSELIDEAPMDGARGLQASGASPLQRLVFGTLPSALPDLCAYALYRYECALRSSAVLGFFGFPTLGYALASSMDSAHFHEVWTYLYALFVLVWAADRWSWAVRRRMVRA
jgi:ABC-type phosphate/phosphonate transport system permease subunit